MSSENIPSVLYRNTKSEYAKSFVEVGEIQFSSLSYFRKLPYPYGDINEGQNQIANTGAEIIFDKNIEKLDYKPNIEINGNFKIGLPQPYCFFIICFSTEPQCKFGDTTIEIFKPKILIDKIAQRLRDATIKKIGKKLSLKLEYDFVTYYKIVAPQDKSPWKWKTDQYQSMREFRLAFFCDTKALIKEMDFGKNSSKLQKIEKIKFQLNCSFDDCARIV